MAVNYDNLWKMLIDKKAKKTDLITEAKISSSALAKLGRNEYVSLVVVDKVCSYLNCNIEDVVTIIKE
jgi:DNA (cytosine-5)-methyltransferase 1